MLFCHIASRRSVFLAILGAVALPSLAGLMARATSAQSTSAQTPQPFSLVQLAELPRVLDPQLSPDGRAVAYMLGTTDWTLNRLSYHLWRRDTSGSAPVAMTSGAPGDTPFSTRWSPDAASILFARGGQLMLMPAAGGNVRTVTKH